MSEKEKSIKKAGKAGKKKETPIIPVKQSTLKEKIDRTVEDYTDNKEELKKQIFGLVQRVLYPDQFCPECNDRLFFGSSGWNCPNCGFQKESNQTPQVITPTPTPTGKRPSQGGKVPPQVEKMIKDAQTPRRASSATKRGSNIRKLVNQMDSGGPIAPTPADESKVRRDGNVSGKINWV